MDAINQLYWSQLFPKLQILLNILYRTTSMNFSVKKYFLSPPLLIWFSLSRDSPLIISLVLSSALLYILVWWWWEHPSLLFKANAGHIFVTPRSLTLLVIFRGLESVLYIQPHFILKRYHVG